MVKYIHLELTGTAPSRILLPNSFPVDSQMIPLNQPSMTWRKLPRWILPHPPFGSSGSVRKRPRASLALKYAT